MLPPLGNAEQQIRLLKLLPGHGDDPILAELHVFSRSESPDYNAISYVWGDDRGKRGVRINGKAQPVWRNCYYALWQARIHYPGEYIWIDSLCIDQDNQEEKGHQVRIMGDVYHSAKVVLVCIGSDTEDVDTIISFAPELESYDLDADIMASYIRRNRHQDRSETPTARLMQRLEPGASYTPDIAQAFKQACGRFASRLYWQRLWIVQELKLSEDKVILCGSQNVAWRLVSNLLLWNDCLHGPWTLFDPTSPLRVLGIILHQRQYSLIPQLSQLKCFDPRDRVYGTLGIIKWTHHDVVIYPDYRRSRVDLASMLLENGFMDKDDPLDLLRMLRIDEGNNKIRRLVRKRCKASGGAQQTTLSKLPRVLSSLTELYVTNVDRPHLLRAWCTPSDDDVSRSSWYDEAAHILGDTNLRSDRLAQRLHQRRPREIYEVGPEPKLVGLACSEAREGDYLAQLVEHNQDAHCLVLRKAVNVFRIVGQAVLIKHNLGSNLVSTDINVVPMSIDISTHDWIMFNVQDLRFSAAGNESDYKVSPRARMERLLTNTRGIVSFAPSIYYSTGADAVFPHRERPTIPETFRRSSLSGSDISDSSVSSTSSALSTQSVSPANLRWRRAVENIIQRERQPTAEDRWVELAEQLVEAHDDAISQPGSDELAELVEATIKSNAALAGLLPLPPSESSGCDTDEDRRT